MRKHLPQIQLTPSGRTVCRVDVGIAMLLLNQLELLAQGQASCQSVGLVQQKMNQKYCIACAHPGKRKREQQFDSVRHG